MAKMAHWRVVRYWGRLRPQHPRGAVWIGGHWREPATQPPVAGTLAAPRHVSPAQIAQAINRGEYAPA